MEKSVFFFQYKNKSIKFLQNVLLIRYNQQQMIYQLKQQKLNRNKYFRFQIDKQLKLLVIQPIWIGKLKYTLQQYFCTFFQFKQKRRKIDQLYLNLIISRKFYFSQMLNYQTQKLDSKTFKQKNQKISESLLYYSSQNFKMIQKYIAQYQELSNQSISSGLTVNNNEFYFQNDQLCQILQKYQIQQIAKIQALSRNQKLFRIQLISKMFPFQTKIHKNKDGCLQKIIIVFSGDINQYLQTKNVCEIMQNQSYLSKNQYKSKLIYYIFSFYQQFKQKLNFFPPKIELNYILFNLQTEKHCVNFQWALFWSFGLIQKPINFQQKLANNLVTDQSQKQIVLDPLIYINPLWKKEQQQRIFSKEKFLNCQKEHNILEKLKRLTQSKYKLSQDQTLLKKLQELKYNKETDWQDIDEFVAVVNILMLIYEITFMIPFDIMQQVKQNQNLYKLQIQNKSFQQVKIDFICQCFLNNQYLWILFFSCIQNQFFQIDKVQVLMKQQKMLTFNVLKQIFIQTNTKQTTFELLKGKMKATSLNYLYLLQNLTSPESALLISVHNAVRYLVIIFVAKLYQLDILYFPQILQNEASICITNISKVQEIQIAKKKINKFLKKSYQKILNYFNNTTETRQNIRIVQVKAKKQVQFVRKIRNQNFQKLTYKDFSLKRKQILQHLIPFVSEFIYNIQILKNKEQQIDFQFKSNLIAQNKLKQIFKFCIEIFLMNFSILELILLKVKYTKIGQLFFNYQGNSRIQEIISNNLNKDLKNTIQILIFTSLKLSSQLQKNKNILIQQLRNSQFLNMELSFLQFILNYEESRQTQNYFFGFNQIKKFRKIIRKGLEQNYLKYTDQWKSMQSLIDEQQLKLQQKLQ